MPSKANYSYPLARYPDASTTDHLPHQPPSTKLYASSRTTTKPPPTTYTLPSDLPSGVPFSITRPLVPSRAVGHVRNDSRFDDAEVESVEMGRGGKGGETVKEFLGPLDTRRRVVGTLPVNVPRELSQPTTKPPHRTYGLPTHIPSDDRTTERHAPNRLRKVNPSSPNFKLKHGETAADKTRIAKQNATDGRTLRNGNPPSYSTIITVQGSRIPLPVPKKRDDESILPVIPSAPALAESKVRKKGSLVNIGRKAPQTSKGPSSRIPTTNTDTATQPRDAQVPDAGHTISKKKSMMRFATGLGSSKATQTDGVTISSLVRSSFGRRRKPDPEATDNGSSTTTSSSESPNDADESVVSAAPVRQSTESDFSVMSDWTIANVSDASFGLPADEESSRMESGEQNGGVPGARSVRKKKSFAAAGVLLGKLLHGPGERKDKDKGKEGGEEFPRKLRHEESTVTLRPSKKPTDRSASPASSIASFESKYPSQAHSTYDTANDACIRSKSPELPTFHFTRPSYSGTNFRAELGDRGGHVPPVPPLPVSFLNKVLKDRVDVTLRNVVCDTTATSALRETTSSEQTTEMSWNQSSAGYNQSNPDESGGSSLVHVENALDIEEEYSMISASVSDHTEGTRHSGRLPWRRSVQGVFGVGENDARREHTDGALSMPAAASVDKRPSLMDLKKVSHVTGTLQDFLADYPASPSTINEQEASMIDGSSSRIDAMMHNLSTRLASPSSSNIMEQDSPTPLRKYAHHPYSRSLKPGSRIGGSPVKVSPLRLALGNSVAKVQQSDTIGNTSCPKIFNDNPFLASLKSTALQSPVHSGKVDLQLKTFDPRSIGDAMSDAGSVYSDAPCNNASNAKATTLLPLSASFRTRGCSTNTEATVSSTGPDDQLRESFDFTGEYRALNENGTRQSFVDELGRIGLSVGEASFEIGNFASGSDGGSAVKRKAMGGMLEGTSFSNTGGLARRNSYGFNKNFKFGSPPAAPARMERSDSNNAMPHSPPRESLPVPEGSPRFKGRFRFKQNGPEDSMFSIASMSSEGPVVDTGIAGTNFINIFDREFGAAVIPRNRSNSSVNRQSSTASADTAGDNQRPHLRKPSHARVPSFVSITSGNGNARSVKNVHHTRQESSLDSAKSVIRYLVRPTVDGERMFETENRAHQLYRIEGSPVKNSHNRPAIDSKASLLDSSRRILNSLPEITEDSIFHSGKAKPKSSHFTIKSIDTLARVVNVSSTVASVSPLALKIKKSSRISPARMASLEYHRQLPDSPYQELADIEKYLLQLNTEDTSAEISLKSNSSFRRGGSRNTKKLARNTGSRPSSFLLGNTGIPALSSPLSEASSRLSTDVQSIISAMLDSETGSKNRWSRRSKGTSLLSEQAPVILEEPSRDSRQTQTSSLASIPGQDITSVLKPKVLLSKWVDWQRLAEAELTKSRTAWQDTKQSIEDVAEFKPPTTAEELKVLLRNSLDLNQPLSEVSPGTQVTHRELFKLTNVKEARDSTTASASKLSALPTKYMRADSSSSATTPRECEDESQTRPPPVSTLFAKFAAPVNSETTTKKIAGSLTSKPVNIVTKKKEVLLSKGPSGGQQRVASTVRREKMGWGRRKDAAALSPAAKRLVTRQSRILHVADKENIVPFQLTKKRVSTLKPVRKPSQKMLRA